MNNDRENIRKIMISVNVICQIYSEMAKKLIIKDDMLSLLYALDDGKPHTQSDICHSWNIPKTTINTIVQECKERKLLTLEEKPENRKEKYLKITDYGKIFSNEILQSIYAIEDKAYNDSKKCHNVIEFLETFTGNLSKETKTYFDELYSVSQRNELEIIIYEKTSRYYHDIEKLYNEAFPINERIPINEFLDTTLDNMHTYIFTYKNNFVGFVVTLSYQNILYLLYFAMSSKYRNRGFGSQALELIKKNNNDKVLLVDIEQEKYDSTNKLQRIKRKKFYLRSGFIPTNITYTQQNVIFEILSFGGNITENDLTNLWNNVPKQLFYYYRT